MKRKILSLLKIYNFECREYQYNIEGGDNGCHTYRIGVIYRKEYFVINAGYYTGEPNGQDIVLKQVLDELIKIKKHERESY